jgi:hypothetical protein
LQFLANNADENERQQAEFLLVIEACVQAASQRQAVQSDFWERVHDPDAALLRALIEGKLADQATTIRQKYRKAFQERSTAYERESVLNQLDFLGEALAWKGEQEPAGQVSRLRAELER